MLNNYSNLNFQYHQFSNHLYIYIFLNTNLNNEVLINKKKNKNTKFRAKYSRA